MILILFLALIICMVAHEVGHYCSMLQYGVKPRVSVLDWRIRIGVPEDYHRLSPGQKYSVYFNGVAAGAVVLALCGLIFSPVAYFFLIPYIWYVRKDLRNVWRLLRSRRP